MLYSVSQAPEEAEKRERAQRVLESRELVVPVQALEEFYVQATRSGRHDRIAHGAAVALIQTWKRFRIQARSEAVMDRALAICVRYHLAYWDAAVVAAAAVAGCGEVLTEGMQHGAVFDGIRICNPFLEAD